MVYMYHSFLVHSSADGHLGCFHVLAMINSAAMNIGVHVSLSDLVSFMCYFLVKINQFAFSRTVHRQNRTSNFVFVFWSSFFHSVYHFDIRLFCWVYSFLFIAKQLCQFSVAIVTDDHTLGGFKQQTFIPSGGLKIRVWTRLVLFEGSEVESVP